MLEVCVNRPGELLVETGPRLAVAAAPELTLERCLSLATAVATFSDQQINRERPLLAATLPTGERIQFVIPPAVPRDTVSITIRKPAEAIRRLDDFEREGLFERTAIVSRTPTSELLPFEHELADLRQRKALRRFPAPGGAKAPDHRRQRQDRLGQDYLHERPGRGSPEA